MSNMQGATNCSRQLKKNEIGIRDKEFVKDKRGGEVSLALSDKNLSALNMCSLSEERKMKHELFDEWETYCLSKVHIRTRVLAFSLCLIGKEPDVNGDIISHIAGFVSQAVKKDLDHQHHIFQQFLFPHMYIRKELYADKKLKELSPKMRAEIIQQEVFKEFALMVKESTHLLYKTDIALRAPSHVVLAPFLNMLRDIEPKTLLLRDENGNTPAHDAVIDGDLKKLEILTQDGKKYCQEKNYHGATPYDIAKYSVFLEIPGERIKDKRQQMIDIFSKVFSDQ